MTLPVPRVPHPHVVIRPDGSPFVHASNVPVRRLWLAHRSGTTFEALFKRYPLLGRARVLDAVAFAYDNQDLIEADIVREETGERGA